MQGPWSVETACLGMRSFQPGDEDELKVVAENSEFVRAVQETMESRGVPASAVHAWIGSGNLAPIAIVLKHSGELIGVYASLPLSENEGVAGAEGVFILKSEQYSQGFASELAQASLNAVQSRIFKQTGNHAGQKPSYSLQASMKKRCHGATVMGFKFTVKSSGSQA